MRLLRAAAILRKAAAILKVAKQRNILGACQAAAAKGRPMPGPLKAAAAKPAILKVSKVVATKGKAKMFA